MSHHHSPYMDSDCPECVKLAAERKRAIQAARLRNWIIDLAEKHARSQGSSWVYVPPEHRGPSEPRNC